MVYEPYKPSHAICSRVCHIGRYKLHLVTVSPALSRSVARRSVGGWTLQWWAASAVSARRPTSKPYESGVEILWRYSASAILLEKNAKYIEFLWLSYIRMRTVLCGLNSVCVTCMCAVSKFTVPDIARQADAGGTGLPVSYDEKTQIKQWNHPKFEEKHLDVSIY